MRYVLVEQAKMKIVNALEIQEGNFTTTFIAHEDGSKYPTTKNDKGDTVLCQKYLVESGFVLFASEQGSAGDSWPLVKPKD